MNKQFLSKTFSIVLVLAFIFANSATLMIPIVQAATELFSDSFGSSPSNTVTG